MENNEVVKRNGCMNSDFVQNPKSLNSNQTNLKSNYSRQCRLRVVTILWSLRKKRRILRWSPRPPSLPLLPPPPPPPPRPWYDGLLICVQLVRYDDLDTANFMRFNIPTKTLDNLLSKAEAEGSEGIIRYNHHSHDAYKDHERFFEYSADVVTNGPFSYTISPFCASCATESEILCMGDEHGKPCHVIHSFDFAGELPQHNIRQLPFQSYFPTLLLVNGRLFVFQERYDFNDDPNSDPFALVYDLHTETSTNLPISTTNKSCIRDLVVASLGKHILVASSFRFCKSFDIDDFIWDHMTSHPIINHVSMMQTKPITVTQYKTLCWVNKHDNIMAFNWENNTVSMGPIIGFANEVPPFLTRGPQRSLVHLKDKLFGLIWIDSCKLHITVLFIRLGEEAAYYNSPLDHYANLLTVFVVACFCYHLEFNGTVHAAYLLQ